jgi:group I intron endonuclease
MGVIYSISFEGGRRAYIGSAKNLRYRMKAHLHLLRLGRHHSIGLQRAANKYGLDNLIVKVLEEVPDITKLIEREQYWIDVFTGKRYNRSPTAASRLGTKMSASARRKISESLVGNQHRVGILHDNAIKEQIAASLRTSYAEGRHRICPNPKNLAEFNRAVACGQTIHPSRNPERDAAIVGLHAETKSLAHTGKAFDITPCAVWYVVKRCNPSQLRMWRRQCTQ